MIKITIDEHTQNSITEAEAISIESLNVPDVVTMRQARLALLQNNMLSTIDNAVANGIDEAMKIEWEYATEVRRDWPSLIALTASIGITSKQLDDLFRLANTI